MFTVRAIVSSRGGGIATSWTHMPLGRSYPTILRLRACSDEHNYRDSKLSRELSQEYQPAVSPGRVPGRCGYISWAHPSTVTRSKRPIQEGSHGIPAALAPLVTLSKLAVRT